MAVATMEVMDAAEVVETAIMVVVAMAAVVVVTEETTIPRTVLDLVLLMTLLGTI